MRARVVTLVIVALLSIATRPAEATADVKHSGTILAVDRQSGVLTLAEVGPWRVVDGTTQVTRRTIKLTPSTQYSVFMRVNAPGQFGGDFIEVPLEVTDLSVGDFVTVDCVTQHGQLIALRVSMADPGEPAT
jgi:hypothetical protein